MPESKENIKEFEFVEDKKQIPREVVIYRDIDDMGRVFVTEETLQHFHLPMPEYKILLDNGVEIYEIRKEVALYIIDHAQNKYAPYHIQYQSFDFDNELIDQVSDQAKKTAEKPIDEIQIFRDIDDSGRAFVTGEVLKRFHIEGTGLTVYLNNMVVYEIDPVQAINIINNSNNPYAPYSIRYVSIEFEKEEDKKVEKTPVQEPIKQEDDYIPGTTYRKPRTRKPEETEEHYVAYLEGYYDSVFKHEEETKNYIPGTKIEKPRVRGIHVSDDAYVDYLRDYYNRVFSKETMEKVSSKNLIKPRERGIYESDEEYETYLSAFYGTPVETEEKQEHRR